MEKKFRPRQMKAAVKRKRGILRKEEEVMMKRTCKNILSWLAQTPPSPSGMEKAPEIEQEEEVEDTGDCR